MKRAFVIVAVVILLGLISIQFFRVEQTNPPIIPSETIEAAAVVPADVAQILSTSCNDCHSHKTVYPWYTRVQPGGWFMDGHIQDARRHLNFSTFNNYDTKKKAKKLEEICEEVESAAMPLPSYLWLHGEAALSPSQRKALCDWAKTERDKLERTDE